MAPVRSLPSVRLACAGMMACAAVALASAPAAAQRLENGTAVFAALDKVTAKISKIPVPLNETRTFGTLRITPRACYSRAPTEPPKTSTFVEIDETQRNGKNKRIFTGWMFAESPGLNAVEHPVFDVWLTECQQPVRTSAAPPAAGQGAVRPGAAPAAKAGGDPLPPDAGDQPRRRRVPR